MDIVNEDSESAVINFKTIKGFLNYYKKKEKQFKKGLTVILLKKQNPEKKIDWSEYDDWRFCFWKKK